MARLHAQKRCQISLGTLLTAWGLLVMWLCWTEVTGKVIDDIRQRQQAAKVARSQPLLRP